MRSFKGWTWLLLLRPPPPTLHICQGGDGNVSIFGSFCKPSRTCRIRGVAAAGVKDAGDGYSVDVLGRYRAWQGLFLRVWLNVIPPPPYSINPITPQNATADLPHEHSLILYPLLLLALDRILSPSRPSPFRPALLQPSETHPCCVFV